MSFSLTNSTSRLFKTAQDYLPFNSSHWTQLNPTSVTIAGITFVAVASVLLAPCFGRNLIGRARILSIQQPEGSPAIRDHVRTSAEKARRQQWSEEFTASLEQIGTQTCYSLFESIGGFLKRLSSNIPK